MAAGDSDPSCGAQDVLRGRNPGFGESLMRDRRAIGAHIPLVATNLVLAEAHRLLLFRAGARAAMSALERIVASPHVRVDFPAEELHRVAVDWLVRLAGLPVTYTDAASFTVMQRGGLSDALSFDRDFLAAGFGLWDARAAPDPEN